MRHRRSSSPEGRAPLGFSKLGAGDARCLCSIDRLIRRSADIRGSQPIVFPGRVFLVLAAAVFLCKSKSGSPACVAELAIRRMLRNLTIRSHDQLAKRFHDRGTGSRNVTWSNGPATRQIHRLIWARASNLPLIAGISFSVSNPVQRPAVGRRSFQSQIGILFYRAIDLHLRPR